MDVFVSSIAFNDLTIGEIGALADKEFSVEFSANFRPSDDLADQFSKIEIDRLPHNYFPPPTDPFVLNLGSSNDAIREKSIRHCVQGLELASKTRLKVYSAHAGFCVDPDPDQLGRKLHQPEAINRDENLRLFLDSIKILLEKSKELNVTFLIENNVLAEFNTRNDGLNPLLCVDSDEILEVVEAIDDNNFGILLDTAHLKVSSNTLGFELDEAVNLIKPYIKGIHHSDNNGEKDSNEPIDQNYWFLPFMNEFATCYHVLEVKNQTKKEILEQLNLLQAK